MKQSLHSAARRPGRARRRASHRTSNTSARRQAERGRAHKRGPQGLEIAGAEGGLLPILGIFQHYNDHQVSTEMQRFNGHLTLNEITRTTTSTLLEQTHF